MYFCDRSIMLSVCSNINNKYFRSFHFFSIEAEYFSSLAFIKCKLGFSFITVTALGTLLCILHSIVYLNVMPIYRVFSPLSLHPKILHIVLWDAVSLLQRMYPHYNLCAHKKSKTSNIQFAFYYVKSFLSSFDTVHSTQSRSGWVKRRNL